MPPAVTGPETRPQLLAELQAVLLRMQDTPSGLSALQAAGFESFVLIEDDAYDSVRDLEAAVGAAP
jgi:ABC-type phosphate/phosphonate transport system substrate-binding protein